MVVNKNVNYLISTKLNINDSSHKNRTCKDIRVVAVIIIIKI